MAITHAFVSAKSDGGDAALVQPGDWNDTHIVDSLVINGNVTLVDDAANVLAQRNSTNAQTFRVYNTYTDASNYERFSLEWSGNVCFLRVLAGGTGTARAINIVSGDVLTLDNAAYTLLKVAGSSIFYVASDGLIPYADNTFNLGRSNLRYTTVYATEIIGLTRNLTVIIDGGGSAITTGIKGDLEVPFDCTVEQVTMLADQTGSIVVDVWNDTYANYPPDNSDSMTASAPPTISSAVKSQDSTLTGWDTTIAANSILRFNVDSVTSITRLSLTLRVVMT